MAKAQKETDNPRYKIDKSKDKYNTRYDRLINILFYADELPSDLYYQMNLSYRSYIQALSILNKRNIIRKVNGDGVTGYIFTTNSKKQLTRQLEYMKYRDQLQIEKDRHITSMIYRSRKRQFAYLYALLDRVGIPYESFEKPPIENVDINADKIYFYAAIDFKNLFGIGSTSFNGSRLLGFLFGKGQIIPVYRTNQMLKTFGSDEGLVPEFLNKRYSKRVDTAILICESEGAVIDITNKILENYTNDPKKGINTAKYKNFYVIASDDSFIDHLNDIYEDKSEINQSVYRQLNINTNKYTEFKSRRIIFGTGTIEGEPVLVFTGNINIVKINRFLNCLRGQKGYGYIVCQERDKPYIEAITEDALIKIITITT